jgi:hypothetical protein
MVAIGLLFPRMLCDCFKPQQRLTGDWLHEVREMTQAKGWLMSIAGQS